MNKFKMNIQEIVLAFCLVVFAMSCDKNDYDKPAVELELLEKVYIDGKLYLDVFYDENHKINRMNYYKDNGEIKSQRQIQLDEQGRVKKVISDFGNYLATRTLTYKGERKVLDETSYEFVNGSPTTYGKRAWEYPKANVIKDLLYADDLITVSYASTFTFLESGNLEKKEREVFTHPDQNTYEQYQYDEGISYEFMIESNIPGYSQIPVAKNQLLNRKVFKPSGEFVAEVKFLNTYNEKGYLAAYSAQYTTGSEEYRFEYKTVIK